MKKIFIQALIVLLSICCTTSCAPIFYTQTSGLGNPSRPPTQRFYTSNIWGAMATDFSLPDETPKNPEVRAQINWYMRHQQYLKRITEQARPYLFYILQQVKRRGLPGELALLPIIESNYDPFAYSKVGASGLWQMMPGTASGFGIKVDWWYDGRRDIIASTNAALDYFSYLGNFFDNQWLLAIAAYDTGEGAVNQAVQRNAKLGESTNFWSLHLSKETQSYVPKLLALATIIKHPTEYPVALPDIPNQPYLAMVNVGSQIDLARVAKLSGMNLQALARLNPGFNRWATDPDIPSRILLPIDKAAQLERNLKQLPIDKRVTWVRYEIKRGDSLLTIAKKYKTTVTLLKKLNHLRTNKLHPNQTLLIPTATSQLTKIVLQSEQHYFTSIHSKLPEVQITNYAVKSGDTLDSIAKKYHVKTQAIRFWNGLGSKEAVNPGTKLIIWPPKQHHKNIQSRHIIYKVKPGDSLSIIAKRHHTTVATIIKTNHIKHNMIHVGQKLIISVSKLHRTTTHKKQTHKQQTNKKQTYKKQTHKKQMNKKQTNKKQTIKRILYRVKKGDSLSTIAKKNHVTVKEITRWNRISGSKHLTLNQVLVIYI